MKTLEAALACSLLVVTACADRPPRDPIGVTNTTSVPTESHGPAQPAPAGRTTMTTTPVDPSMPSQPATPSSTETRITADIREHLMASEHVSSAEKDVTIITIGTKVTLVGVVRSDAEKSEIETVARATFGVTDLDNVIHVRQPYAAMPRARAAVLSIQVATSGAGNLTLGRVPSHNMDLILCNVFGALPNRV